LEVPLSTYQIAKNLKVCHPLAAKAVEEQELVTASQAADIQPLTQERQA
jgi:hypothetical protein